MSKTLYVVGDSFSYQHNEARLPPANRPLWFLQVAGKLKCTKLLNFSLPGVSQDYCWFMIIKFLEEMNSDDVLLITLTDYTRKWFIKDEPEMSNFVNADNVSKIHKVGIGITEVHKWVKDRKKASAIKDYLLHLQNEEVDEANQLYKLGWLHDVVRRRNLKNICIVPSFDLGIDSNDWPLLNIADGDLNLIQHGEFPEGHYAIKGHGFQDIRFNHMCLQNHGILADKISSSIISSSPANLNDGFLRNVLTEENINNLEFIENQLDYRLFEQ